jgi:N2227-like protein
MMDRWAQILLIPIMLTGAQTIVFFGHETVNDDCTIRMRSTVSYAGERYRESLKPLMESLTKSLPTMDAIDAQNEGRFRKVHDRIRDMVARIPSLFEANEFAISALTSFDTFNAVGAISLSTVPSTGSSLAMPTSSPSSLSSDTSDAGSPSSYEAWDQLLVHLSRDWGATGAATRDVFYRQGIIAELKQLGADGWPATGNRPRCLVPGGGLGRLGCEIAATMGYDVELNEISSSMVLALHTLVNDLIPTNNSVDIYPHIHLRLADSWDTNARCRGESIPCADTAADQAVLDWIREVPGRRNGSVSIHMGEFQKRYSHTDFKAHYDIVVTCFFIDTARNFLDYLSTILHTLAMDGIWMNLGPLHWHDAGAVPYSYDALIEIINLSGFEVVSERRIRGNYCGEDSMKPEMYDVPLFVMRRINLAGKHATS